MNDKGEKESWSSLRAVLLVHRDDVDRTMVESEDLVDVHLGFRLRSSESGFEETRVSFLEVLKEERDLLTEDDGDDVDGSGEVRKEDAISSRASKKGGERKERENSREDR